MELNIREALRYLGVKSNPTQEILAQIEQARQELEACITPKSVYEIFDCHTEKDKVFLGNMVINSTNLAKNLAGCNQAALFAVTLGSGPDVLVRRYGLTNTGKGAVIQAVSAAMCESFCDKVEGEITKGRESKPRFSPGFGDFSLEFQRELFRALDCTKRIGIYLNDSCIMTPSKSVTAVVGLVERK